MKGACERITVWLGYCLSVLLIGAIAAAVLMSFLYGINRGDDGKLTRTGRGQFVWAVCGIVTQIKFDHGRYACSGGVRQQMQSIGLWYDDETLGHFGKTTDQWLTDTAFLNEALSKIFNLPTPPELGVVAFGWGGDAGYMDFLQFSFAAFGRKIPALYYSFFALLVISAALFCVQFRRRHFALFTVLAFAFSFYVYLRLLPGLRLQSAANPRLLSILTLMPLFHALFIVVYRVRAKALSIALFAPQAALMAAIADSRSLAFATPLALTICCAIFLAGEFARRNRARGQVLSRYWPLGLVFLCIGLSALLQFATVDRRIAKIEGMRFHTFWEPIYYDLQLHPDWNKKYAAEHQWSTGDDVAKIGAKLYEQRHHLPQWTSELGYERDVRGAYMDFVLNDPWYVVQLKYYNALTVIEFVTAAIGVEWKSLGWLQVIIAAIAATGVASQIRRKEESLTALRSFTAASSLCAVLIAAPVWAMVVQPDLMTDLTLCFVATTFVAALLSLVAMTLFVRARLAPLNLASGQLPRFSLIRRRSS